jgi:hypothetical protein
MSESTDGKSCYNCMNLGHLASVELCTVEHVELAGMVYRARGTVR